MQKINLENFSFDKSYLDEQKRLIHEPTHALPPFMPYKNGVNIHQEVYKKKGQELISKGKVGCILVAGGQGTRLGFDGPKGCCPLTAAQHKTLFHYFSDRVRGASFFSGIPLKIAIMTSPENHAATLSHFVTHHYFGLDPKQVSFFQQSELPFLNSSGEPFLQAPGKVAVGPDGNGSCIKAFFESPIAKQWEQEGILYTTFILVDNPLGDPFDPYLIGAHASSSADVTLKCLHREDPKEKLGLVVMCQNKPSVIEYMEAPDVVWNARDENGNLTYSIANISLFCFSLQFLSQAAKNEMPLHKAFKKSDYVNNEGVLVHAKEPNVWKFERFIFDILEFSHHASVAVYPREQCFAPVKDKASLERATAMLTAYDRQVIGEITGKEVPSTCLEIDPLFYTPTPELLAKWKGRTVPSTPYISAFEFN